MAIIRLDQITRAMELSDLIIGARPGISDLQDAAVRIRPDALFLTLLRAFPTSLSGSDRANIRSALSITTGSSGTNWSIGSAAPSGGSNSDWYLRTGSTDPGIYYRSSGVWALAIPIEAGTDEDEVNRLIDAARRILLDTPASADTLDKLILHPATGDAFLTEPRIVAGTPAIASFEAFTRTGYLGVFGVDPDSTTVGNWYFNRNSHRPRVLTDLDPTAAVRLSWGDVTFGVVIPPPTPNYLGEFADDTAASTAPGAVVGSLYYQTTVTPENEDGELRRVRSITPATSPTTVYDLVRVADAKDIARLREADQELRDQTQATRQSLIDEGQQRMLGDDLQSVMVNTAASYNGTLDSQRGSAQPLILEVGANIRGDRRGSAFSWDSGDILYFPPLSETPEPLFNIPEPGSGGTGLGRAAVLALFADAAQRESTDRWPKDKLPADTVYGTPSGGGNTNFIAEEVLTTTYYDTVLTAQASRDRPLFIWVTAAISGSRGGSSYSWDPQDILYVQPNSDTPIELFNLGATPDDIRLVDQRRADGDAALAARIENLDRNLSFDPPYFVRTTTDRPPARTLIIHVPPSSQPAGTTHVGLAIQGVNAAARVEVSASGAYTFTIPSTGVANISRVQSSTAQVRVTFYDAASGGNDLGYDDDVIRLVANAPSELPTDGADGEFLGHVRGAPAWVAAPGGIVVQTLTDAATITWNVDDGATADVTLGGGRTLAIPTGGVDGGVYMLRARQDSTGNRTLALNTRITRGDLDAPVLSTAANSIDLLLFTRIGTAWRFLGVRRGS